MSRPDFNIPPMRFRLVRTTDVTGVSGEGHVADGVIWPDGTCAMRWRTGTASVAIYNSVGDIEEIHGHNGATIVDMVDHWELEAGCE